MLDGFPAPNWLNAPSRHRRLWIEQGGRCFLCKQPMEVGDETIEHVMPKSMNPLVFDVFRNKVLAHRWCNHQKAGRKPTDAELTRLMLLKRPYADVDYDVSAVKPEIRKDWLSV